MARKISLAFIFSISIFTHGATWEFGESIPQGGRPNPFDLSAAELEAAMQRGRIYALNYPVTVTGALLPYRPIEKFLDQPSMNPLRALLQELSRAFSQINGFREAMQWLGLHEYPANAGQPGAEFPLPRGFRVGDPMGLSFQDFHGVKSFTFACAACHVSQLFGRPIFGLTNRFPRANALFIRGKTVTEMVPSPLFALATGASDEERLVYKRTRQNMVFVASKRPEILGLDTSLSHVALSLARRVQDPYAEKDAWAARTPRNEFLETFPADSKPAVWWGAKYKNRWLVDGAVVSGNPIYTNILWNEIGRGSDLHELSGWLRDNGAIIRDLTTAVFSSEPPAMTEFFPAERWELATVRAGEILFNKSCARCHGVYEKAWNDPSQDFKPWSDRLKTTKVIYNASVPSMDVGTDSARHFGMASLVQLNQLEISQANGVRVVQQRGYVPPPLVGIWARFPYFHNNSVPSLCALLTAGPVRPETYWSGEPLDRNKDFDFSCNGYPLSDQAPARWKASREHFFDANRPGLSRLGHDERIFLKDGKETLSPTEKAQLISFLQTL